MLSLPRYGRGRLKSCVSNLPSHLMPLTAERACWHNPRISQRTGDKLHLIVRMAGFAQLHLIARLPIWYRPLCIGAISTPQVRPAQDFLQDVCERCFSVLQWPNSSRKVSEVGSGCSNYRITELTALRKSELLNLTWGDIDFEKYTLLIFPKQDADETWEWKIKDTDCRILPLTEDTVHLLVNLQNRRPEGYPYVFIPPVQYDHIQEDLRKTGRWILCHARTSIVHNFDTQFKKNPG